MPMPDSLLIKQRLLAALQLDIQDNANAACEAYEALLQEWPGQVEILLPLAKARIRTGKPEQAVDVLATLLSTQPDHREALEMFYNLAAGPASALCCERMERLVAAQPHALTLRAAAAGLYLTLGKREEELAHLEVLNRHDIRAEAFYLQYATALRNAGRIASAIDICKKALADSPQSITLLKLRGDLFLARGECEEALRDFMQAQALAPDNHHTRLRVGAAKMLMSDLREGIKEFGAHYDLEIELHTFAFAIPEWRGEPLAGKRLLIWASQGIGDIVMFAGFLPWVMAQGVEVTFALYPRLMPLFARSFPQARVVLLTLDMPALHGPAHDYHIAIGQLMALALPHYTPAVHPPYLKADAMRTQALREQYLARSAGARKKLIGISWHTNSADTSVLRTIPLSAWQPLLSLPHLQFVSLQYGSHAKDIALMERVFPGALIHDPAIDAYRDTDGLAAQTAAMDEVISIDNSAVHLAGALGVPVTLLLSSASEWRWGYGRTTTRWYGSLTIERQEQLLNWTPVMKRVRKRLA